MAVIEDEFLSSLFHRAADTFEVPKTGPEEILRRAMGFESVPVDAPDDDAPESPMVQPASMVGNVRKVVRQHRVLSVAAAVVVVAAIATSAALVSGTSSPNRPVVSAAPLNPTSTTVPLTHAASRALSSPAESFGVASGGAAPTAAGTAASPLTNGALPATPKSSTGTGTSSGVTAQPARIEQTGTLTLRVGRHALATTMSKLTFLADANGGFVANSQTSSGQGGAPTGTVTLQVPVNSFSAVLKSAQALGATEALSTKAADVTSQYVNLQEQITALQATQQQYLLIMTKATTIGDILSVESQLSNLATQIDQLQGQENLLNSETTYSTLTVEVTEATLPHHHVTHHRRSGLSTAWHDSLHGFSAGVDGLVRIAGPVLFGLLCLAALLVLGRLSWRRYQRHRL